MRSSTYLVAALIAALFVIRPASAEWRQTRDADWKATYACDAGGETCAVISCQLGRDAQFGIWSKQFETVSQSAMRRERRFDIDIDGAALVLPVEDGEYQVERRVIFWGLDRQLLQEVETGSKLSIRRWGDPRIDLRENDALVARTVEGCSLAAPASAGYDSGVGRSAGTRTGAASPEKSGSRWSSAGHAAGRAALLSELMPRNAICERSGGDADCRLGEQGASDPNWISARFDGATGEVTIRAEIAHSLGDHEGYRSRLYDTLAGFGIPQSFADDCMLKGAVTLDVAGSHVDCDSDAPPGATIATFRIVPR
ncbi:hypothetical protein [Jiella sp. M17.18]|uniref:hypothetical protein n=1 Tax=Jiella sp. M17.18 TaxID=3234247 RepID=UPI0034DFFCD9